MSAPMKFDAQARARHRGAAETGERIHRHLNASEAVQPQALLGQLRWERRGMGSIAIAPLDGFVGDEPRVAAATRTPWLAFRQRAMFDWSW